MSIKKGEAMRILKETVYRELLIIAVTLPTVFAIAALI